MYDPRAPKSQILRDLGECESVSVVDSAYTAAADAHALLVITEWAEFSGLDYQRIYDCMVKPSYVFDGRNMLDHGLLRRIGFEVHAIGKPSDVKVW